MSDIAGQLGQQIEAVQQERHKATIEMRRASVWSRNEKARRLVSRLEDCDESIANLLSQAADCLETLVTIDSRNDSSDRQDQARELFEARAQDWFGSLHDVQMGLRSAVKKLRKAQVTPIAHDASTKTSASSSPVSSGSASRGHSLALLSSPSQDGHQDPTAPLNSSLLQAFVDVGQEQSFIESSLTEIGQESKLSLSALRLQESSWRDLANSLQDLAIAKQVMMSASDSADMSESGRSEGTVRPNTAAAATPNHHSKNRKSADLSAQEMHRLHRGAQDLLIAQASQDARLLSALVQDGGFKAY